MSNEGGANGDADEDVRADCVDVVPNERLGSLEANAANGFATAEADGAGKAAAKGEADEEPKADEELRAELVPKKEVEEVEDDSLSAVVRPDNPNASPVLPGDANEKEEAVADEDAAAKGDANVDAVEAPSELPKPNDGAVEADDEKAADTAAGLVSALAGVFSAATDDKADDDSDETDEEVEADAEVGGAEKEKDGAAADVEKEKEGAAADVEKEKDGAAADVEKENAGAGAAELEVDVAGAVEELLVVADAVVVELLAVEAAVENDDVLPAEGENSPVARVVVDLPAADVAEAVGVAAGLPGLEGIGTGTAGGGDTERGFLFVRLGDSGRTTPDAIGDGAAAAVVAADGDLAACASLGRDGLAVLGAAALPVDAGDRGENAGLPGSFSFLSTVSTGATGGGVLN